MDLGALVQKGRYQQCLLEDHESTRHLKKCR
jgi:hypothetical protein